MRPSGSEKSGGLEVLMALALTASTVAVPSVPGAKMSPVTDCFRFALSITLLKIIGVPPPLLVKINASLPALKRFCVTRSPSEKLSFSSTWLRTGIVRNASMPAIQKPNFVVCNE